MYREKINVKKYIYFLGSQLDLDAHPRARIHDTSVPTHQTNQYTYNKTQTIERTRRFLKESHVSREENYFPCRHTLFSVV